MADKEQVERLKAGVEGWNQWRRENPRVRQNLSGADLNQARLQGANLYEAILAGANLSEAFLRGTDLRGADLSKADLHGADLNQADLHGADLERAFLAGADFYRANLHGARLQGAILSSATLSRATLRGTDLRETDLAGAYLAGADLAGANLAGADLQRAILAGADLRPALLTGAFLSEANLAGANLEGADLEGADLREANLAGAVLSEANLAGAVLRGTVLRGANFAQTGMSGTIVARVDLRTVIGLDTVQHWGPSEIAISTLYASGGDIPDIFLRGCGVPESMIEYARSLVTAARPIDYYSCFISYSSHDEALARRLHADLQAAGVRCWFAPHDLTPGTYIVRGIDEAIRLHDKLVLLLSEGAIKSNWVEFEVQTARTREAREGRIILYPVRLDDEVLSTAAGWAAQLREARHIGDFRQWKEHDRYQESFARLLHDLRSERATRA